MFIDCSFYKLRDDSPVVSTVIVWSSTLSVCDAADLGFLPAQLRAAAAVIDLCLICLGTSAAQLGIAPANLGIAAAAIALL